MRARRPSWSATSPAGRLLLAIAAVLAVLATGAFATALRMPPTRLVHTVRAEAPKAAVLDAAGCPVGTSCLVRPVLPGHIRDALDRAFPAGVLRWQSSTVNAGTGEVYQALASVSLGRGADLLVTASCLPGTPARVGVVERASADQRSDLAGNQLALFTLRQWRVPGAPGCQLDALLSAPAQDGYRDGLDRFAHDPAAQVRS